MSYTSLRCRPLGSRRGTWEAQLSPFWFGAFPGGSRKEEGRGPAGTSRKPSSEERWLGVLTGPKVGAVGTERALGTGRGTGVHATVKPIHLHDGEFQTEVAQTFPPRQTFQRRLSPGSRAPPAEVHTCGPFPPAPSLLSFSACLLLCTPAPGSGALALGLTAAPSGCGGVSRMVEPRWERRQVSLESGFAYFRLGGE